MDIYVEWHQLTDTYVVVRNGRVVYRTASYTAAESHMLAIANGGRTVAGKFYPLPTS